MEPYLGQIELFPFNYAPSGWMPCQGQTLNIQQYQGLFALISNIYGGDGVKTFMLPDLRGRAAINWGGATAHTTAYPQGMQVGTETVALTSAALSSHTHTVWASQQNADTADATGNYFAQPVISKTVQSVQPLYASPTAGALVALNADMVSKVGGGSGHDNMQPYLTLNYCIAVSGIFPMRD